MSGARKVKISELEPTSRGELCLVFEVHEVVERMQVENREAVTCRVVDETGIITALFDQYATKFTVGTVFEIQNFRCRVVDHHLRLEMIKTTLVAKQPLKMGFKDLQNDLSAKFYVTATKNPQGEQTEPQEISKKIEETALKIQEKPKPNDQKQKKSQKEGNNKESKDKTQKQVPKVSKEIQRKQSHQHQESEIDAKRQERKLKKYVSKPETNTKGEKQQQTAKQTHKQKKEKAPKDKRKDESEKQGKKPKFIPKCVQIKLAECPKLQEEQANFVVRVNLQTGIKKEKYFICKVSDPSGSTYFEFHPSMSEHLQDKAWYRLIAFRVFKDRDYGFIATQEKHSSFELLPNWEEKADVKLLWQ